MAILFHLPFLKANKRTFPFLALLPTVAFLLLQSACVQPPTHPPVLSLDPLTPQEQQLAERLASADARVKDLLGRGRQRLIHSEFLALKPEDEARTREDWRQPIQIGRHAEVIFYRYDGNLVSCLRGSLNRSPGYGSLGKACHPEPFAPCHPEHIRFAQCRLREGSSPAQGELREGSQTSRHSSPEPALSSL